MQYKLLDKDRVGLAERPLVSGLLSPSDIEAFRRDGAVVVRGAITPEEVEILREVTALAVARVAVPDSGPRFYAMLNQYLSFPAAQNVFFTSKLRLLAADVLGTDRVNAFGDHMFVKEPGTDTPSPWHQDQPYFPIVGRHMCTTWVALDVIKRETGSLKYVKGSHNWDVTFQPVQFGSASDFGSHGTPLPDLENGDYEILCWDLEPGDCLVHHCRTLHSSEGNKSSTTTRRAYAPRFVGHDMKWDPSAQTIGNLAEAAWPTTEHPKIAVGETLDGDQTVFPRLWQR